MRYTMLGVEITASTQLQAEQLIQTWLGERPAQPKVIFTPNPEIIVYAQAHPDYQALLNTGDLNLPDGTGVVWLSQRQLPERITGSDLLSCLLAQAKHRHLTVGAVLKPTGLSSASDLPDMMVTHDQFATVPDIVVVALGFPEQERWVQQHLASLGGCRLVMTVGGGIDFLTGKQQRAPLLFRRLGLEWLWRWLHQPWRWRRIVTATIVFPYLVLKQRWFHD